MGSYTNKPSINLASLADQALRDKYTKEKADAAAAEVLREQKKMDDEGAPIGAMPPLPQ